MILGVMIFGWAALTAAIACRVPSFVAFSVLAVLTLY